MSMNKAKKAFVEQLAGYVQKYAPEYGISVCSPIIAQGILESAWGKSKLSEVYFNFFGLKCGSKWIGKSVNMTTQEEYRPGTKTTIKDNFRVYDSMEEGVRGYFEFIQLPRYANLRGITDPLEYLRTIRDDGYATASDYAADCYKVVEAYDLTAYDPKVAPAQPATKAKEAVTADTIINIMYGWKGLSRKTGTHKPIIDLYNDHKPLARNYRVSYTDNYCATTISAAYIKANAVDLIGGTECGVERMIEDCFKPAGIWKEDGRITPKRGWIITYNWDDSTQPNNGWADHIGLVVSVTNGVITVIEGNYGGMVRERQIRVGDGRIRGYAVPKYSGATAQPAAAKTTGYTGTFPLLPSRGYYKLGDGYITNIGMKGEVKNVQKLLNWINGGKIAVDGEYGKNTTAACKLAQTNLKVKVDGLFGKATLAAAKNYKK